MKNVSFLKRNLNKDILGISSYILSLALVNFPIFPVYHYNCFIVREIT